MFKKTLPPPERVTFKDLVQVLLGLVMIPLGLAIVYGTLARGAVPPALLIGGAFVGLGVYRTTQAWGRWRWFRARNREARRA